MHLMQSPESGKTSFEELQAQLAAVTAERDAAEASAKAERARADALQRQLSVAALQSNVDGLEKIKLAKKAEQAAELDDKTGLLNSTAFLEKAQKIVNTKREHEKDATGVVIF